MYKQFIFNLLALFLTMSVVPVWAQESTDKHGKFYLAFGAGAGMNAWEIGEAQFSMVYYMSSSDYINSLKSVSNQKVAPHFNVNMEVGNTRKWFANLMMQGVVGGMLGFQVRMAGGINLPFETKKRTLLVQVGAAAGYLNSGKVLDSRRLREPIWLQGKSFNTFYMLTTSLTENNFAFSPLVALKYPIGKIASLHLATGYQFIIIKNTRIRFSQKTGNGGRNSSSSTRTANFSTDDTLFDFQYNNQHIQRLPFDYSGFFLTLGGVWTF
jgi:hypothetical protein